MRRALGWQGCCGCLLQDRGRGLRGGFRCTHRLVLWTWSRPMGTLRCGEIQLMDEEPAITGRGLPSTTPFPRARAQETSGVCAPCTSTYRPAFLEVDQTRGGNRSHSDAGMFPLSSEPPLIISRQRDCISPSPIPFSTSFTSVSLGPLCSRERTKPECGTSASYLPSGV